MLCCVVLHNLTRKYFPDLQDINMDGPEDIQGNFQPGLWWQDAGDFWNVSADNHRRTNARGKELRDYMADYFLSDKGAISIQDVLYIKARALLRTEKPLKGLPIFSRPD